MDNRFSRLEIRESDWKKYKDLQDMMEDAGDVETFEGVVEVENSDAYEGCYEDIENYCISKGIAFDRFTEETLEIKSYMRIYRPREYSIDVTIVVNLDIKPYVLCDDLEDILNGDATDKEKLNGIRELVRDNAFPCPLIGNYRSQSEKEEGEPV